jgi:hypothetical protein
MKPSIRWSRLVTLIGGGAVAAFGLAVVVGWHTHALAILQSLPGLIAPVYNTGLSFLLCGGDLLAISLNRPALALPCGARHRGTGMGRPLAPGCRADLGRCGRVDPRGRPVERQNAAALHQLRQAAQDLAALSTQLATIDGT